ncbi:MAG TPA: hypothetical protein VFF65_07815, partial [Phycisphaerales bacterium]|nr:hypothetical protein [Phycisphaerales bacterium]
PPAAAQAVTKDATMNGKWVVGEPKWYRIIDEARETLTSPDNPGHKTEKAATTTLLLQIVPKTLQAAAQTFELRIVSLKIDMPTPLGQVAIDTDGSEPADDMSKSLSKLVKKVPATIMTVSVKDGRLSEVTGNEALTDPKSASGKFLGAFVGDAALAERATFCFTLNSGAAAIAPGAAWRADSTVDFRRMMTVELPAQAKVESVNASVAKVSFKPAGESKVTPNAEAAKFVGGTISGTVTENLLAGELLWSTDEDRLVSGTVTTGFVLQFAVASMKGEQRSIRTVTCQRVAEPAALSPPSIASQPAAVPDKPADARP